MFWVCFLSSMVYPVKLWVWKLLGLLLSTLSEGWSGLKKFWPTVSIPNGFRISQAFLRGIDGVWKAWSALFGRMTCWELDSIFVGLWKAVVNIQGPYSPSSICGSWDFEDEDWIVWLWPSLPHLKQSFSRFSYLNSTQVTKPSPLGSWKHVRRGFLASNNTLTLRKL